LGSNDNGPAVIGDDSLQSDVIVENLVLEVKTVEILGRGGTACKRAEGNTITFLAVRQGGFEVTPGVFLKINLMFAAPGEHRRQAATGA